MTDIDLIKITDACPEQWEARQGDRIVGYLRVRFSRFTVQCPDVGGECVYESTIGDSGWDGCFNGAKQRSEQLAAALVCINDWVKENGSQIRNV